MEEATHCIPPSPVPENQEWEGESNLKTSLLFTMAFQQDPCYELNVSVPQIHTLEP